MNRPQNKLFIIIAIILIIIGIFVLVKQTNAPIINNSDNFPPVDTQQNENETPIPIPPVVIPTIPPTPKVQTPITIENITILPLAIVEDSRCPQGVMCIWAGRFILKTRITKDGKTVEVNLELGQEEKVLGSNITLTEAEPSPNMRNQNKTPFSDYKFTFEVK